MYSTLRCLAMLAALMLVTGCSIMHPVAQDYDRYLDKNQGAAKFDTAKVADQYFLPAATRDHHYEFRSVTTGYANVWVMEFGTVLDATMKSQDVVQALGKLSKASSETQGGGKTIIFDLNNYTFEDFGAHIAMTISVRNASGEIFKKAYTADGKTQGGKMFWAKRLRHEKRHSPIQQIGDG
ncbi:hypothetical protein LP419_08090 [Massilia sp. H-1]|nr:hypothetical protein LP419_08090 [Massilia sp. H-1]